MIQTSNRAEKYLQQYRFRKAMPWLVGDVLDFGGNEGELAEYVKGSYTCVNYDHGPMHNKHFDTIVSLAVIEHLHVHDVYELFRKFKTMLNQHGRIIITTPTPLSKPVLECLAFLHILEKHNIAEHKHYWNKKEIFNLADKTGFSVVVYQRFQFGFNQFAAFTHQGTPH